MKQLGPLKQTSPLGKDEPSWSKSVDKYPISGTSTNLISEDGNGGPTCPHSGSNNQVKVAGAVVSV